MGYCSFSKFSGFVQQNVLMEKEEEINAFEMELCFQWGWTVVSKEFSIIQDGRSKGIV